MHRQHADADQSAQDAERIQQVEERSFVERPQGFIETKRHSLQNVAERHAEHQRRHEAGDEQRPVPHVAPARIDQFVAERESHRSQDQRRQHQEHGDVETGERHGIEWRPRRKDGPAAEDEPHLVALPDRFDGFKESAAFFVGPAQEAKQHADAEIEAVSDCETGQQHAQQCPPDHSQQFIFGHQCAPS